jgi:hypothetical protein
VFFLFPFMPVVINVHFELISYSKIDRVLRRECRTDIEARKLGSWPELETWSSFALEFASGRERRIVVRGSTIVERIVNRSSFVSGASQRGFGPKMCPVVAQCANTVCARL